MNYNSRKNQDIKAKLVNNEVIENVNELIQHLLRCDNHDYTEEVMSVSSSPDYESACSYYLEDAGNSELIELAQTLNIDISDYILYPVLDSLLMDKGFNPLELNEDEKIETITDGCLWGSKKDIINNELKKAIMLNENFSFSEFCNDNNLDCDYIEAYEFWSVSSFLATKLQERGEMIEDIMGFTVWGRCTTGQAILLDYCISSIAEDMEILEGMKYEWK